MRPSLRVELHNTWTGEFLWSVREGKTMSLIPRKDKDDALKLQQELVRLLKVAVALAETELEEMYLTEE